MGKKKSISLFSVSFSQGFSSPKLPIATFYQGDKELVLILDSGSDNNLIDASILPQFNHTMLEKNPDDITHLAGVGGNTAVSNCKLTFGCEDENYTEEFLVVDLKKSFDVIRKNHCVIVHGILGSNFMKKNNIVLDFKELAAYSK